MSCVTRKNEAIWGRQRTLCKMQMCNFKFYIWGMVIRIITQPRYCHWGPPEHETPICIKLPPPPLIRNFATQLVQILSLEICQKLQKLVANPSILTKFDQIARRLLGEWAQDNLETKYRTFWSHLEWSALIKEDVIWRKNDVAEGLVTMSYISQIFGNCHPMINGPRGFV